MKSRTNPTWAVRAALLFLICWSPCHLARAQGLNNLWMGGTNSEEPMPFGGTDLNFISGNVMVSYTNRDIDFRRTSANITDQSGNLLMSTNGSYLANATGDTMLNGSGLNPSAYTALFPEGLYLGQSALVLPKPQEVGAYYLIHGTVDDIVGQVANFLYLTAIDMGLDGGLGGVVLKNQILIADDLNVAKITAVRHANGRDWWVFCHKANTNTFYRLLVTPDGVSIDGTQSIGINRPADAGQVCFSPDGSRFAYYWGDDELEVFDFDRCSGLFSNAVFIVVPDAYAGPGVAFSPNSRFLYVSSVEDVYQYDMQAADIEASMVHIATWDGFYSPGPPFATLFDIAQLAPDGKVYIATGNSTLHLHVIHDPDQPGLLCNMVQHDLELPTYYSNSLPNHPNYHLGPVDGSLCDSLGINTGLQEEEKQHLVLNSFPNPTSGPFMLSYPAQSVVGELEVRDLSGRIVRSERIPQWSTVHRVALDHAAEGLYMCRMRWQGLEAVVRIIIER